MWGIVGTMGTQNAFTRLISVLEKLGYRCYDAVGSALCADQLLVHKTAGKLSEIRFEPGCTGITHRRLIEAGTPSFFVSAEHQNVVAR